MSVPKFTLTGKVNQVGKDSADAGIDQDKTVLTGWVGTLTSNYPKGVPLPDGSDIDYIDVRTITLLSDGSITEDGTTAGISLTAHDPAIFATPLQWTIQPGTVTLVSGQTFRPKKWTFNAPLDGTSVTLGGLTPVAGIPLQPAPDSVPWDSVSGKPAVIAAGVDAAAARAAIGVLSAGEAEYYANLAAFPGTGIVGLEYVAIDTGNIYRWNTGTSAYVQISAVGPTVDVQTHAATGKTTPVDADEIPLSDSAASFGLKKFTWANIKATLKSYFESVNIYTSVAALRAATVSSTKVRALGYYALGDGGGGVFYWDGTDTTSTDNGGTIITPTSGLSSSGRWKRVYDGAVNTRWFGVNPSQADNTAAMQKAATWVCRPAGIGGELFTPMGRYEFLFGEGTSGLSTITIDADNVLITGEGKATRFSVANRSTQLNRFFTISKSGRGQGGGARDFSFFGGSKLKLGIYLTTWRDAEYSDILGYDVHEGILDAEATDTANWGEGITVRRVGHTGSTGSVLTQYGVRFRGGANTGAKTWSDCKIDDLDVILVWDAAVVLDGVTRFKVDKITAANNGTSSDTIDGTSKSGCNQAVLITKSATVDCADLSGFHVIDDVYLESQQGSETPATNAAVVIHQTTATTQIWHNKVSNVATNGNVAMLKLVDDSGASRLRDTVFRGNRVDVNGNVIVGAGVKDTDLYLTPDDGRAWDTLISDAGTNTRVNGLPPAGIALRPPPEIYSSFTGANGSAPDSTKFTTSIGAGAGAAISVQGNALQLTSGYSGGGYTTNDDVRLTSTLASTLADGEVEFCLTSSSVTVDSFLHVALRSAAAAPWIGATAYFLQIEQAASGAMVTKVVKRVASSDTPLFATPSATMTAGQKTWFRFRVKGTKLQLWTWADGAQIPRVPAFTGTDSSVTGGGLATFALLRTGSAAAIQKIDNAAVYAL